jgi:hypothetical protein
MGVQSGPNTIDNGLVFHYDAANVKSFRGETTTNAFNSINNSFDSLDLYTWATGGSTSIWVRDYTQKSPVGGIALKQTSFGTDSYSQTYNNSVNNLTTASVGESWTASVYVKAPLGVNVQIWLFEANSNGNYTDISVNYFNATGDWQRISVTRTLTQTSTNFLQVRVATGTNNVVVYWDGLQIERKNTATPFIVGSRGTTPSYGGGLLDLSINNNDANVINGVFYNTNKLGGLTFDGVNDYIRTNFNRTFITSINIWFYTPTQITSGGLPIGYGGLGNYGTSGTINPYDGFIFGDWTGGAVNETIGYYQHNPVGFIYIREVVPIGYHNLVMNYNSTEYTYDFFLNGVKVTRYTASQGIVRLIYSDVAVLGCTGDPETVGTPYYGSPTINIVQVYNRTLTNEEIIQNYNANKSRFI